MLSNKGRFIVVEGLEGAGKSTAIKIIKDYLEPLVADVLLTREPGGTRVGETIRQLIKEPIAHELIDPRTELLLLYAARVQLVEQVIRPALKQGTWVLADRFELSTFAYQGGGRGIDSSMLNHLSSFCLQQFKPDLIFFLDLSPEQGLLRVKKRGATDRIEQESVAFFHQVYKAYIEKIHTMDNVVMIDASQPLERVRQVIITQLKAFYASNKS